MIHTFTLACRVDYSIINEQSFLKQIYTIPHLDESKKGNKKLVFLNDKLSATLSKDEMESMPLVYYEHINHKTKGKVTGYDDYVVVEINYQKSLANKKYFATPVPNMKYAMLQAIMDLVCKAMPVMNKLNTIRTELVRELRKHYQLINNRICTLSELELFSEMVTAPSPYIQKILHHWFTDESMQILSTPTVSDKAKMTVINSSLSFLNLFKVRRIDYALDILTDYKDIYMDLLAQGILPPNMKKKHIIYYGTDENGDAFVQSKQAKTYSVSINFYDKEKEMMDKGETIFPEDSQKIHNTLRLEIQVHRRRINYLIGKDSNTVEERLLKDVMDGVVEEQELSYYFSKVIGGGQYFTYTNAIQLIQNSKFKADKRQKLCKVIGYVAKYHGISIFLDRVKDGTITDCGKLKTVQGYLRDLQNMGINPVTISRRDESVMKKITPTYQVSNVGNYVHGVDYLLNPCTYLEMQLQKEQYIQDELMNPNSALVCAIEQE